MKVFLKFIALLCFFSIHATQWKRPDLSTSYNQICFLVAHNAFSSVAHGYIPYAQQALSVEN